MVPLLHTSAYHHKKLFYLPHINTSYLTTMINCCLLFCFRMAMKKWFRHLQPVQLYLMLGLTIFFFLVQLIMSHMTHALTLLVDSYHMLCNAIALVGCIITIKVSYSNNHHARRNWCQLHGKCNEIFCSNQP
jgi:Co/Zn/Cd efflux system component